MFSISYDVHKHRTFITKGDTKHRISTIFHQLQFHSVIESWNNSSSEPCSLWMSLTLGMSGMSGSLFSGLFGRATSRGLATVVPVDLREEPLLRGFGDLDLIGEKTGAASSVHL